VVLGEPVAARSRLRASSSLDTGSSDLWVLSDACASCTTLGVPLYHQANLQSSGLNISLLYGDSLTGTHANGVIGKDVVGVAGMTLPDQYFAAISDTNSTVLQTGSAGIFGLGFPVNRCAAIASAPR